MTENSEFSAQATGDVEPRSVSVTLKLPPDVVALISQRARQLGQSPSEVLVNAIRVGLGSHLESANLATPLPQSSEWEQLVDRLTVLEMLIPQVKALEDKVNHLLAGGTPSAWPDDTDWQAAIAQTTAPLPELPALDEESWLGPLDQCPKCHHRLGPPLKSSGRQVCSKCGWSNKPRRLANDDRAEPPPDDLTRLLTQAAQESEKNMKPKKQQPKPGGIRKRFPPFG